MFLWVLWAAITNYLNPRRMFLETPIYNQLVRNTEDNLGLQLAPQARSEGGRLSALVGIWCYLQVDCVRIQLNCKIPALVGYCLVGREGTLPTPHRKLVPYPFRHVARDIYKKRIWHKDCGSNFVMKPGLRCEPGNHKVNTMLSCLSSWTQVLEISPQLVRLIWI